MSDLTYRGKNFSVRYEDGWFVVTHPVGEDERFDSFEELVEAHPIFEEARQFFHGPPQVKDLVPQYAQYEFDPDTNLATVEIETKASRPGDVVYGSVTAKLTALDWIGDWVLNATYVSHEGELTKDEIGYALKVIENNDFGIS